MRRALLASVLCSCLAVAGCGGKTLEVKTVIKPVVPPIQVAPCTTLGPPCSAITPEGAREADRSHFVEGAPPPTLLGGEVQTDTFGVELTGSFENVYQRTYCPFWDPYGHVWTRALGETDWSGDFGGRCITRAEAVRNLRYLLDTQYLPVVRSLRVNFSHPQVDALGDLSYNVGPGVICCYLAGLLRAHAWASAASYISRYSYAGGQFLSGLYARRQREGRLLEIVEHPETPAQRRAREERELAGARHTLAGLRGRILVLRRVLLVDGCDRRVKHHERTGERCKRWRREGGEDHARGRQLDGQIAHLKRELG